MPSIAKQHIRAEGNDGKIYSVHVEGSVCSKGHFRIKVPPELEAEVGRQPPKPSDYGNRLICVDSKRGSPGAVVDCIALEDALRYLRGAAKRHMDVEVVVERVIGISYTAVASFWVNPDGSVQANGTDAEGGQWWEPVGSGGNSLGTNNVHVRRFTLGFAAQVLDRKTYKRASGDTVQWKQVREGDKAIERLSGFFNVNVLRLSDEWHDREDVAPQIIIPYTPAAADRLADLMLGLCKMVGQVDAFFADAAALPDKLLAAGPLRLSNGGTETDQPHA